MTPFEILFAAGYASGAIAFLFLAFVYREKPDVLIAGIVFGAFTGFTAVTVYAEGPIGFIAFQSQSLWGVQVFYDLIIAVGIALAFIIPRARAKGMMVAPWVILCGLIGCVGLAAMATRLLWLEKQGEAAAASAAPVKA